MRDKAWFLCISNEALGPFSTSLVAKLLQERRVTASDYAWADGLAGWTPLAECEEFQALLPGSPSIPLPKGRTTATPAKPLKAVKAAPVVEAPEAEPEAEPEPEAVARPAAKAKKPAATAAPAPAPQPKPTPVEAVPEKKILRVAIDATVKIGAGAKVQVLQISESGVVLEQTENLEIGADVKLKIESPSLAKALELTGVIAGNEPFDGKPAISVEFTRVNPAHKRAIAQYIAEKQGAEKSAA